MSPRPSNLAEPAAITIDGLTLEFQPGRPVLDKISLSIPHGQFVSIVGPSGCGKTTVLNLLAGLINVPYSGDIQLLQHPPRLGSHNVAYMLARDCMLPWRDALGNASFGMEVRGISKQECQARAARLLARVGLAGFEQAYPKQLSHGMRQRCALARTFALDSSVLLMDEPFGALDAQTKLQLEELLVDLWQAERRTVVFITHDIGEAIAVSDRVIVMSGRPGRIVSDTLISLPRPRSVRELQKSAEFHQIYAHIWEKLEGDWRASDAK
ncbi:ABC transporter ATP-binding protein [Polaromonas sp. C04]|nr:ABC transporter ATP-binding protein [Polaromonas sp. C04]